jgi:hypothetical protein
LQLNTPPRLEEVEPQLEDHPKLEFDSQLEEVSPRLQAHPHLQEAPLHFEDFYLQPRIPQRRSSLYFSSQRASHAQQSHRPPSQFEDLFQGLGRAHGDEDKTTGSEQSQEQGDTSDNGSVTSEPKCEANMRIVTRPASKRHTIHFGSNLGEMKQQLPVGSQEKEGRAHVSPHQGESLESMQQI